MQNSNSATLHVALCRDAVHGQQHTSPTRQQWYMVHASRVELAPASLHGVKEALARAHVAVVVGHALGKLLDAVRARSAVGLRRAASAAASGTLSKRWAGQPQPLDLVDPRPSLACCAAGAGAAAGAPWCSCTTCASRGPIIESTARCASALPVPHAAPATRPVHGARVCGLRASGGGRCSGTHGALHGRTLTLDHASHQPGHDAASATTCGVRCRGRRRVSTHAWRRQAAWRARKRACVQSGARHAARWADSGHAMRTSRSVLLRRWRRGLLGGASSSKPRGRG